MGKRLNSGGKTASDTPSVDLLNRRLGTSPAPRMLTASEKKLLRQGADEIAAVVRRNAEGSNSNT
ncbi:MAG: hypothetical protein F4Y34_04135 [Gammaproteobacteria bacterium]|nr:hypothetical protein [Gammaproteobacteria bacterium]